MRIHLLFESTRGLHYRISASASHAAPPLPRSRSYRYRPSSHTSEIIWQIGNTTVQPPSMSKVNKAPIKWAQRSDSLYITIALPGKLREVPHIRVSFSVRCACVAPATGSFRCSDSSGAAQFRSSTGLLFTSRSQMHH